MKNGECSCTTTRGQGATDVRSDMQDATVLARTTRSGAGCTARNGKKLQRQHRWKILLPIHIEEVWFASTGIEKNGGKET